MNCSFPKIETIDDVLPHIKGRDEIKVYERESYTVIDYVVAFKDTFDVHKDNPIPGSIRRECRGLVFDKNGKLISRPYHKFFNINEREETHHHMVDLSVPHVIMDKLDGAMVHSCVIDEEIRLLTRNGITSTSLAAEEFIKDKPKYIDFIGLSKALGWCCIFEWCSSKNDSVIKYPEDNLILTGMRCINSGGYADYAYLKFFSDSYDIPLVELLNFGNNIFELIETIKNWDPGKEGIVIRFRSGDMVKIKSLDYVLKHKAKDSLVYEKDVIRLVLEKRVDDILPYLNDDLKNKLSDYNDLFWMKFEDTVHNLYSMYEESIKYNYDQKQFALKFIPTLDKKYHRFMYILRNNGDLWQDLIDYIQFYIGSSTRVDTVRWVWGDLKWDSK